MTNQQHWQAALVTETARIFGAKYLAKKKILSGYASTMGNR
jgi:hypothetical protein